jgi:hypothetical protein
MLTVFTCTSKCMLRYSREFKKNSHNSFQHFAASPLKTFKNEVPTTNTGNTVHMYFVFWFLAVLLVASWKILKSCNILYHLANFNLDIFSFQRVKLLH